MNKFIYIAFLSIVISSCASTTQFVKYSDVLKEPQKGYSKIIVIRKNTAFGSAISSKIYQDNKLIGKLGYANVLSWQSKPIKTVIVATTENKDSLNLNLKENKTYYLRLDYSIGFLIGRAKLKLINKEEFLKLYSRIKNKKKN